MRHFKVIRLKQNRKNALAVAGLLSTACCVFAQENRILENVELHQQLTKNQGRTIQIGERFPSDPLDCRYYENASVDHILLGPDGEPQILLTSVQTTFAFYHLFPNILHLGANGKWMRTAIPNTFDGWTHIHRSRDGKHVVLAMDNIPESSGWETRFVLSDDAGNTWRYGSGFRKYIYFDVIRYFKMSESGVGTAVEHYAGDVGGYEQAGYYIFETDDWGRSWSDSRYEESFDATDYTEVYEMIRSRIINRHPLSDITLPDFGGCLNSE